MVLRIAVDFYFPEGHIKLLLYIKSKFLVIDRYIFTTCSIFKVLLHRPLKSLVNTAWGVRKTETFENTGYLPWTVIALVFPHRALVNAYKLQPTPGVQKIGISLFFTVVDYVSDETQRHPPTRQFFTSCIEILGQVKPFPLSAMHRHWVPGSWLNTVRSLWRIAGFLWCW